MQNELGKRFRIHNKQQYFNTVLQSPEAIIHHAYSRRKATFGKSRTEKTLLNSGWIKTEKDQHGLFIPGDEAPEDFKSALTAFNNSHLIMLEMLKQYNESNGSKRIVNNSVKDFNYELAIKTLQEQSKKNPGGAAAQALQFLRDKIKEFTDLRKEDQLKSITAHMEPARENDHSPPYMKRPSEQPSTQPQRAASALPAPPAIVPPHAGLMASGRQLLTEGPSATPPTNTK